MGFRFSLLITIGAVLALVLGVAMKPMPHDEAALLTDWSTPPPWPVFIAVNMLAGALRAGADALTPPPIKLIDLTMGYQRTTFVYLAQTLKIPDILAKGPHSAAEIAAEVGSDGKLVERLMYACAANGIFKLGPASGATQRFVNTAVSAVLRVDHPNSLRDWVGNKPSILDPQPYPLNPQLSNLNRQPSTLDLQR